MQMKMRYKVHSVSADGRQAILMPGGDFNIENMPGGMFNVEVKSTSMNGWILFDTEVGNILKSGIEIAMEMGMKQGEQEMKMSVTTKVNYRVVED